MQFTVLLQFLFNTFSHGEFLPNDELIKLFAKYVCTVDMKVEDDVCGNIVFLICGFDRDNLNDVSFFLT